MDSCKMDQKQEYGDGRNRSMIVMGGQSTAAARMVPAKMEPLENKLAYGYGDKELYYKKEFIKIGLKPAGKYQNLKVSKDILSKCNEFKVTITIIVSAIKNEESAEGDTCKYMISSILLHVIKTIRESFSTWEFHYNGIKYKPPDEDEKTIIYDQTMIADMLEFSPTMKTIINSRGCQLIIPHRNESLDVLKTKIDIALQEGLVNQSSMGQWINESVFILLDGQYFEISQYMTITKGYTDLLLKILMVVRTRNINPSKTKTKTKPGKSGKEKALLGSI